MNIHNLIASANALASASNDICDMANEFQADLLDELGIEELNSSTMDVIAHFFQCDKEKVEKLIRLLEFTDKIENIIGPFDLDGIGCFFNPSIDDGSNGK